jgi:hypothetical protein
VREIEIIVVIYARTGITHAKFVCEKMAIHHVQGVLVRTFATLRLHERALEYVYVCKLHMCALGKLSKFSKFSK